MRTLLFATLFVLASSAQAALQREPKSNCAQIVNPHFKTPVETKFDFPGIQIASVSDPTQSTGATVFYFARGANVNFDARGGSVAAVETTLLEEGSYSNQVDAVLFAGGSTMGLAAADGVRDVIFQERKENASDFDFIPSVPGAVVFDYGGRIERHNEQFIYPNADMGRELMANLSSNRFLQGRAGAGTTTTSGKISNPLWGGQAMKMTTLRDGTKIMVATVVNAHGDLYLPNGKRAESVLTPIALSRQASGPGKNTTLSIVITNAPLDRSALKRLAVMVHSSMARTIRPFHSPTDGDILFAASTGTSKPHERYTDGDEIGMIASDLMEQAVLAAATTSNEPAQGDR